MRIRSLFSTFVIVGAVSGCASKVYPDPDTMALQDPLPGKAIIYLMRAPFDNARFQVYANQKLVARLPKETYTAVSLEPGSYTLRTTPFDSDESVAPDAKVELQPDTRYFLLIAGSDRAVAKTNVFVVVSPTPIVLFIPAPYSITKGTHTWRPNSEAEARPMLSIATLVLPER